ncbi:SH3 domain and tetratricopeptide repeat-containing protein 1-like isoform X1 [Oncorhynchus masou masou]|uniref:SH3 domain and tetratricopeptide repeat-containing protein 1-like isoform X1 n=1 Tax=Oncorhynchus masou masou TaxID=90313 RepID=UPI0031844174
MKKLIMSTAEQEVEPVAVVNRMDTSTRHYRRELSTEDHNHDPVKKGTRSRKMERSSSRGAGTSEDCFPTALPMLLAMVEGPDKLPADEGSQEVLRGKLRLLEADSIEVNALFMELSARLVSINCEENAIFVTFKTFEEIWRFTTYYTMGFLGQCMENLLLDQDFWLSSLDQEYFAIEISIQEETLNLMYKGILMQEGSLFASCSSTQMFDSSTSGRDLYLEQGDIALFEPPFLGSGWTVLSLGDGARGTKPKPVLEPVIPFHQWFLKSCAENILVGSGKPACDFPCQFATGSCVATVEYDAGGPDELSLEQGDRIIIVGLLVSCFEWFTGRLERTGEVGLVMTTLVRPADSLCEASDIFLEKEERLFFNLNDDQIKEETIALLKKINPNDVGHVYKLDLIAQPDSPNEPTQNGSQGNMDAHQQAELRRKIEEILLKGKMKSKVPHATVMTNGTLEDQSETSKTTLPSGPHFTIQPVEEGTTTNQEKFLPLLSFLGGSNYKPEFGALYGQTPERLLATFTGHSDDVDKLVAYLGVARETARKKRLHWSQSRLCFLLGKLCAGRSKFSQARVYFEEALSVPRDIFTDMLMLASIYANLAVIYLMQKNTEKYLALSERIAALLMGIPYCVSTVEKDSEVLKFILKKAVLSHNKMAEARACFLLAKLHWRRGEAADTIPFLERLLVLLAEPPGVRSVVPSHGYLSLAGLYSQLSLPHLCVSSARRATMHPSAGLADCLNGMGLVLENTDRLYGIRKQDVAIPAQVAPYLSQSLSFTGRLDGVGGTGDHTLSQALTLCLSQLFQEHGMLGHAVRSMHTLIDHHCAPSSSSGTSSIPERNIALVWLAWLHICNSQPEVALDVLDSVLASMPEHCTTPQEGLVHNMRGVALRSMGDLRRAADSYQTAIDVCVEFEDRANWAVAEANLGLLCLKAGAKRLAEQHLTEAVEMLSALEGQEHEVNFTSMLLELGQYYVNQRHLDRGKIYYEWALLMAIKSNHSDSQLSVTRRLCHLYRTVCPDEAQCIIYNEHQLALLVTRGDRRQEGEVLETISQLYLSLGTERARRSALDYTKRSLGIFIDLGRREKEAYAWLQAGKIYHLLGQTELVDLYLQVAQDVGVSTGDTHFILQLLEAAGDVFFNSSTEREKAVCFYGDRALPIAVKTSSTEVRLRLSNKLVELLLQMKLYGEAVEYAQTALDISVKLGNRLNERVAFHRLATLYHCLGQFELAEHYYLKALSLCPTPLEFDEETLYYVRVYRTLGDIIFYDLKDPYDAAGYYHLALAAAMDIGNKKSQLQLCTRLATIYHNFLVDRELSLFFYQKARAFASDLNVRRINLSPDQIFSSMSQYKTNRVNIQEPRNESPPNGHLGLKLVRRGEWL